MQVDLMPMGGSPIAVDLDTDCPRPSATIFVAGVPHHLERIHRDDLLRSYRLDDDPDYVPATGADGYCFILTPFSRCIR